MEKGKRYDEDQERAIDAHGGYYLVLAPPGCGKTDILAERIARARSKGVEYEDMLCLTFTNRASRGMRNRIKERVGEDASGVFVGNIHKYCSKYIYENNVVEENTSILDDDDQADLFMSYAPDYFTNGIGEIDKGALKAVADLASYISQSQLGHPEELKYSERDSRMLYQLAKDANFCSGRVPMDEKKLLFALEYLEYKRQKRLIDFEDILILAFDHMWRHDHRRYPWIQVDEVQDLNPLQLAIADQLTAADATVMYLGDEQQAIFSFMGAKLSQLGMLKDRCAGHVLSLGKNYRAPSYMLDVCNDYAKAELGVDQDLLPVPDKVEEKQNLDLILTESDSVRAEEGRILNMVKYYMGLHDEERLAILVTRNKQADDISAALSSAGISNFKISGQDMFRMQGYRTLSSFYNVLANDFNTVAWARLLKGIGAEKSLVKAREEIGEMKRLMMTPSDLLDEQSYTERFYKRYTEEEIIIFDTETTGLDVHEDDIVQLAAFKVWRGKKVWGSDFDIIMHTDKEIPAKLGDKPNPLLERYANSEHVSREEGLRMFLDYAGSLPMLGHNVTFDSLILKANVERTLGEVADFELFDSLHIIKCVEPHLRMYKLEFLVDTLNLSGKNSHLANEDIEATKALVDYCADRIANVLPRQAAYRNKPESKRLAAGMQVLAPLRDNIQAYLCQPISLTHRTIVDELRYMYGLMLSQGLIKSLGPKFDVFLQYVQSEWAVNSPSESLYDQICTHIYDISSTLNEGDLVNSVDLLSDRVFIMTVYKGKGLEFDNVVVLQANEDIYPFYMVNRVLRSRNSTERERREAQIMRKEDARKFYVAISRAKKRLCISYTRHNQFGMPTKVTPFIESIRPHFSFFKK